MPVTAYLVTLGVSIVLLRGDAGALYWLLLAIFLLVAGAANSAWAILIQMGRQHRDEASPPAATSTLDA